MARVTLAALGATLVAVAGFAPGQPAAPMRPNAHARCSSSPACSETSRRALLGGLVGATVSVATLGVGPQQALAGYVMNLGIEQTMPKDAERDDEAFQSSKAQTSLKNLLTYKAGAKQLKAQFDTDTNIDLIPTIRQYFDFAKLRDDLNTLAIVFDENTQLTMDRLSRAVLYDLTELENASRIKKGETTRTEKKIAGVNRWFGKLDKDFDAFLVYFS